MQTISANELASHLRVSVARLARRLRQEGSPGDTPSQHSALATLYRSGPLTLGELAATERVRPPTMTRIVASLEDEGLVRKEADPSDGRVVRAVLTAGGRRAYERARRRRDAWLSRRMQTLAPEQLELLSRASSLLDELAAE